METNEGKNFIERIIDEDLKTELIPVLSLVFHRNPMVIYM